jgi:hypothetical protein
MNLSQLIQKIASTEEVKNNPPVLIDIGASEKLNSVWAKIAPFSICIAFDADKREFDYIEKNDSVFKKQYVFNKIVVASSDKPKQPFYLTSNPYCSSLLKPDAESLKQFHISNLFEINQIVEIDVMELKNVLAQLNISIVDWFKTDSQGTDLRLYASLTEQQQNKMLVLEFEPGFMDAYLGEDKLLDVMNHMKGRPYFLTTLTIKGGLRITYNVFTRLFKSNTSKKIASHTHKKTPGWAEMVYMNTLEDSTFSKREFMLGWLFATLQDHHDVAHTYAVNAQSRLKDSIFEELKQYSEKCLKSHVYSFKSLVKVFSIVLNKYFSKN